MSSMPFERFVGNGTYCAGARQSLDGYSGARLWLYGAVMGPNLRKAISQSVALLSASSVGR